KGVKQRTLERLLDALVVRALDSAGHQGVLRDPEVNPALTRLLTQRCQLLDGKTGILGGDQAMRLGSHVRQFGNDLFLLLKIERHCFLRTGSVHAPARANPSSDLRIHRPSNPPASFDANLVAVPGKTCSGCTICAGFCFEISSMRSGFPLL